MALDGVLNFFKGRGAAKQEPAASDGSPSVDLSALFAQPINMAADALTSLRKDADEGMAYYESLHETRLKLALTSFDEDMRNAMFEILFLLHVNDPSLAEWHYESMELAETHGAKKPVARPMTANLYVEGAPHGVRGIANLPAILGEPLRQYVKDTFGMALNGSGRATPAIVSVSSGGSIGTIGHKSGTSDLDLNIQYDLAPFLFETSRWSNETFAEALADEQAFWVERAGRTNRRKDSRRLPQAPVRRAP